MCIRIFLPANGEGFLCTFNVNISVDEYMKQPFGMLMNHDFETRRYNRTGLLVYSHFVN